LFISLSAFCSAGLLAGAFVLSRDGSKLDSSEWPGADGAGFGWGRHAPLLEKRTDWENEGKERIEVSVDMGGS
jgi:hypothetical protein